MIARDDLRAEADRLKAAASIGNLIGETLPLKRTGRYLTALCPFHAEKTPSFCVYADHFHCFGCGAHGDVFAWLMQAHGITFPEAVRHLGGAVRRQLAPLPAPSPMSCDAGQIGSLLAASGLSRRVRVARPSKRTCSIAAWRCPTCRLSGSIRVARAPAAHCRRCWR